MALEVKRKPDEPISSFLYRFNRLLQQSGILKTAQEARFYVKKPNRRVRRLSAIYRAQLREKIRKMKKAGLLKGNEDLKFIKRLLRNPKLPRDLLE